MDQKIHGHPDNAEHTGYLAFNQTPDGTIHLLSSRLQYRFNLLRLKQAAKNLPVVFPRPTR